VASSNLSLVRPVDELCVVDDGWGAFFRDYYYYYYKKYTVRTQAGKKKRGLTQQELVIP
jgi:hypothetical protein